MDVTVEQDPGGDLTVKLEGWTLTLRLMQEFRNVPRSKFKEATKGKRKVWAYEVKGPLFPFGEGGAERTRAAAWEEALKMVPQGVILRHWNDLPVVPNVG